MTKFERAKHQTREKWEGILKDLPEITKDDFQIRAHAREGCGFCQEYYDGSRDCDSSCPASTKCNEVSEKIRETYDLYDWHDWNKYADDCRWVLSEIEKVTE